MRKVFRLMVALSLLATACTDADMDMNGTNSALLETKQALSTTCTIVLGGGGKSQTIQHSFTDNSNSAYVINTSSAWDFIRSTSGACKFTIYNEKNQGGRYVALGTDLDQRIRAGEDGVRYKDDGGGETWRVRSVKIEPVEFTNCFISIGGGGVRMHYYPGNYEKTPAMDRLSYFMGGNCDAIGWNASLYSQDDYYNRFIGLHTNARTYAQAQSRTSYDPGFRIRSLKVREWGQSNCTSATDLNRDYGRCLPNVTLPYSAYSTNVNYDKDKDGLHDYMEDVLAETFLPIVHNHSTEDATRPYSQSDITNNTANSYPYTDYKGNKVIEPVVVFQVRKSKSDLNNRINIAYTQIWKEDINGSTTCPGHHGDTQGDTFTLETTPASDPLHGRFWWLVSTNIKNESSLPSRSSNIISTTSNLNSNEDIEDYRGDFVDDIRFHHTIDSEAILEQEDSEKQELTYSTNVALVDIDDEHQFYPTELLMAHEKDFDKSEDYEQGVISPAILDGQNDYSHEEFEWKQGDTHLRAPLFDRLVNDQAHTNRRMLYYYGKGKHHAFQDTKYSSEKDVKNCSSSTSAIVYSNGRGELHSPAYPARLWNINAPSGGGDQYHYNNVGSRNHFVGFVNALDNYGFPRMKVWRDACFYSKHTSSAAKNFLCSNNVDKKCCLESNQGCNIPSDESWCCHKANGQAVGSTDYVSSHCRNNSDVSNWSDYNTPNP